MTVDDTIIKKLLTKFAKQQFSGNYRSNLLHFATVWCVSFTSSMQLSTASSCWFVHENKSYTFSKRSCLTYQKFDFFTWTSCVENRGRCNSVSLYKESQKKVFICLAYWGYVTILSCAGLCQSIAQLLWINSLWRFPGKLISRRGDTNWSTSCADSRSTGFFLWKDLKSNVYVNNSLSVAQLRENLPRDCNQD